MLSSSSNILFVRGPCNLQYFFPVPSFKSTVSLLHILLPYKSTLHTYLFNNFSPNILDCKNVSHFVQNYLGLTNPTLISLLPALSLVIRLHKHLSSFPWWIFVLKILIVNADEASWFLPQKCFFFLSCLFPYWILSFERLFITSWIFWINLCY